MKYAGYQPVEKVILAATGSFARARRWRILSESLDSLPVLRLDPGGNPPVSPTEHFFNGLLCVCVRDVVHVIADGAVEFVDEFGEGVDGFEVVFGDA